jgi:Raf kinase inhibitor-like YbhB/YbcL family protein
VLAVCGPGDDERATDERPSHPEETMNFTLTSPAFEDGTTIPTEHTCDGTDESPPLSWEGAPQDVASYALIVDDPDAPRGTFVHWVLYDLPGHARQLPGNVGPAQRLENLGEAAQGENDFGEIGWRGPCPPPGPPHRYVFRLYALDARLGLDPGVKRQEVGRALEDHVIGTAELSGTYGR